MRKSMPARPTHVTAASAWLLITLGSAFAQSAETALTGRVFSDREGAMEGVVVSARQTGSTMTVSVVSNAEGKYSFPASRLTQGHYDLTTRAAGYVLNTGESVEIAEGKTAVTDLKLRPAAEVANQLTNAEWIASAPGEESIKRLLLNCTDCHGVQRIFESRHSAADFLKIFERMGAITPVHQTCSRNALSAHTAVHPCPPASNRNSPTTSPASI